MTLHNKCDICNKKLGLLVFKCNYCNNGYCSNHRIQEDHNCKCMDLLKNKYKEELRKKLLEESTKDVKIIII
jgi:predicted nucleic acid binding AN1-type Zn finger protein